MKKADSVMANAQDIPTANLKNYIMKYENVIKCMEKDLKNSTKRCVRASIEHLIALLSSYIEKLKSYIHKGAGVSIQEKSKVVWKQTVSAFKSRMITGVLINHGFKDSKMFLRSAMKMLRECLDIVIKKSMIKVNCSLVCSFKKVSNNSIDLDNKHFNTKNITIDRSTDLKIYANILMEDLLAKLQEFEERDSGWTLSEIIHMKVNLNKYEAFSGSSYIELPRFIKKKKHV